jgi:bifunctional DNA-binding transcriptional regulator/antitoxin component of YhaV-PrlF toxin-antitoxin module
MDHQGRLYVPKAVRESLDIEGKSATLELKVAVVETHE